MLDMICFVCLKLREWRRGIGKEMHFEGKEKASKGKCVFARVTDSNDYLYHPTERDIEESLV